MDLGLKGRRAIVCASSRGLGRACASVLAENGVEVTINGMDPDRLTRTAAAIADATGARVRTAAGDLNTPDGRKALLETCPEPDILITNNGGPPRAAFSDLTRERIFDGLAMNMVTPIELIQAVLPGMVSRRFGRIVNITSMTVKMPLPLLDLSSGARAGLTAFCAGIAREVARHNVTINNLLPGFFDTDRLRSGFAGAAASSGQSEQSIAEARAAEIPAARFGEPLEFGQACAFLCSAGYITGQSLLIDGGRFPATFA